MKITTIKSIAATLVVSFFSFSAMAQLPNAGFENWTSGGAYDDPDGWGTPNSTTSLLSVYTVEKETANVNSGSAAIKLTSRFISFPPLVSTDVPGIAVTGNLNIDVNTQAFSIDGGFVVADRPEKLTGYYRYAPQGSDELVIAGFLWKNNGGTVDTIGTFEFINSTAVSSYTLFEAVVDYRSTEIPDSARIILSSSSPTAPVDGSSLLVDDLAFVFSPVSVQNIDALMNGIKVYPNPAKDVATVEINNDAQHQVSVYDVNGRLVREELVTKNVKINLENKGIYIYNIKNLTTGKVVSGKLLSE